jgi:hypothetical protein
MKMPGKLDDSMLATCGMNCAVCYKHVGAGKYAKPCSGCLKNGDSQPGHCRKCKIKNCAQERGHTRCFECEGFPCALIKNLEKSYNRRYKASLIENGRAAKEVGISAFLEQDRKKWTCAECGGAFSLHDNACSDCGGNARQ